MNSITMNVIQQRVRIGLTALLVLSACATTTPTTTIQRVDGQVQLADSHLGERYSTVIARATESLNVEPACESRKVALSNQRKAFLYDVCGFEPKQHSFADRPLSEVVYHFFERELVRVDVRASGEGALLDTVRSDMNSVFAALSASQNEVGNNSYQWVAEQQLAGVRAGTGASKGNVHVRLLDATLQNSAPWLAGE